MSLRLFQRGRITSICLETPLWTTLQALYLYFRYKILLIPGLIYYFHIGPDAPDQWLMALLPIGLTFEL